MDKDVIDLQIKNKRDIVESIRKQIDELQELINDLSYEIMGLERMKEKND